MNVKQDFFISHASADKQQYVQPLSERLTERKVTFWLDSLEIGWGDNFALKINEGLRESRFAVICLSEAFISRPWPETELGAAFAMQNSDGKKKVLPLILNNKDRIIQQYPLVGGLIYREFSAGVGSIADELATLAESTVVPEGSLHLVIESIHTGRLSNLIVPIRSSVKWLAEHARQGAGLKDTLDSGGFSQFHIRWVLVDSNAEEDWDRLDRNDKRKLHAMVKSDVGLRVSHSDRDRLADLGVYDGIVFHLYAVEDDDEDVCYHVAVT